MQNVVVVADVVSEFDVVLVRLEDVTDVVVRLEPVLVVVVERELVTIVVVVVQICGASNCSTSSAGPSET